MDLTKRTPFIKLEHGSGGALSRELIEELIFPTLKSGDYNELLDASPVSTSGNTMMTTDTYVIDPPVFPGGNIGKLAVFGTCNDLAVSGAKPLYLSVGIILEEGFPMETLTLILKTLASSALDADVKIVTGDTKVVPEGKGGGIYINTSGIGERRTNLLSPGNIKEGDAIILSGPIGSHGISILAARENLSVGTKLVSDCANLYPLCAGLFSLKENLRFMRDATRGGVAAVLNEITEGKNFGININEKALPVLPEVASVSDLLGLNPLEIANEGVFLAVVSDEKKEEALSLLKSFKTGEKAAIVGRVAGDNPGRVILKTLAGGRRILDFPRGLLLPRIC